MDRKKIDHFQINLKNYKLGETIGHGSYADVYLVIDLRDKQKYAAKVSLASLKEEIDQLSFEREVTILSKLKNASFVGFVGFSYKNFQNKNKPVIITEYIPNGSLATVIDSYIQGDEPPFEGKWNDTLTLINIYGVASGMAYLHKNHIIHRDMKPENVLLDANFYPRITDFGLSKILDADPNHQSMKAGTPQYMAPEIINGTNYNTSVDVYAYGVIIYELITKTFAYSNLPLMQVINKVTYGYRPTIPEDVPAAYRELIESCWAQNSCDRPSFNDIVEKVESDPAFITETVNRDQFIDYVNYVKNFIKKDLIEANVEKPKTKMPFKKPKSFYPSDLKKQLNETCRSRLSQADHGDNDASFSIGKDIFEGLNGFPKNEEIGLKYLEKAASFNHPDSLIYLGDYYMAEDKGNDKEKGKSLLYEASASGNDIAMVKLGNVLQHQEPPDYVGAGRLFKKAADQNNGEAMLNYGFLLKNGQGVQKSIKEAVRYYKKSCDAQFPRGMNAYGVALENGWVTGQPDEKKAVQYYIKSAEANCPAGMRNLAFMYRDGRGIEKNDEKAAFYFHKAAQYNDDDALMNYGYMLQTGRGVEVDKAKAAKYYKQAAKLGNDDAMYHLGLMLLYGDGLPKDIQKAGKYFKEATDRGNQDSERFYKLCQQHEAKKKAALAAKKSASAMKATKPLSKEQPEDGNANSTKVEDNPTKTTTSTSKTSNRPQSTTKTTKTANAPSTQPAPAADAEPDAKSKSHHRHQTKK